ncbi:glycosyltransferase [Cognatishimia sp. WU-CL00825]|uniref:glycosyltransferase family 2 protein n=1 Tax=Cognatishimia sp. WU-CL00825 TaxID=3127658 RepID=UPI00310636BB
MVKTSIIIPASNEAAWISHCLEAVLASVRFEGAQIIVVANGCQDKTADVAKRYSVLAREKGWSLDVIELEIGDKLHALNVGDRAADGDILVYLDADVRVSSRILGQIERVLDRDAAAWASGKLQMAAASRVSKAYARFWGKVPFMAKSVPGAGLFAVNRQGRARWANFPDIISDDMFVRLNFSPRERLAVSGTYIWPVAEGWANLVKVRRRQNKGVAQLAELYPDLMRNEDKGEVGRGLTLSLAFSDPIGFLVYSIVALRVRLTKEQANSEWSRGR